ncbi:LysR family transcriptional regulator [Streptomyces tsukubensis]|uniref:LysR family transcriptional regulator n=1 Tax=Streptomyces tsukubensis TaxID=83656 RepID=A0A1V4A1V5_9ACTN|nr:LysR family transcriptional regulator [Streptomyces tsukubensis]OON72454.1 LysR family transcriptional regulator [Streptomyces tsukubensis]QFR96984.1 LysR family transcriptional regulator [Streptomyces tsukubensis]
MIDSRLRILQMVAEHGTVTAAAQALHYTPSAVSYQMRQLAADVGVELVVHQGRGIRLTNAARTLLRHAERLHEQWELARAELAAFGAEPTGQVTLCGFSTAASRLLPPAAAGLRDAYPLLTVCIIEAEPDRCFDLLLSEKADLALLVVTADSPPLTDQRFDQQPLRDDPLDLVVPKGHALIQQRRVTLVDAAREPWIVGNPGTTYHQLVLASCMSAGFVPHIAHYADEWDTGTALVAHGFGVILVPRLAQLREDLPVARIPLDGEPAPARRIMAVTRLGARKTPTLARAVEIITATAARLLPEP